MAKKSPRHFPALPLPGLASNRARFAGTYGGSLHSKANMAMQIFTLYTLLWRLIPACGSVPNGYRRSSEITAGRDVTRAAYESLVKQTLELLKKNGPYDGLYFDIHGAMSVEGLDDPEGDLITRIREVIGKKVLISTCMDLHGNVSWRPGAAYGSHYLLPDGTSRRCHAVQTQGGGEPAVTPRKRQGQACIQGLDSCDRSCFRVKKPVQRIELENHFTPRWRPLRFSLVSIDALCG